MIGCGEWGKNILRDLVALGCDVPVVARTDASIAHAKAGKASHIANEIGALGECDRLVVATPTALHYSIASQALTTFPDIPIYVEKPLTNDLARVDALAAHRARIFVMDKWRYHTGVLEVARLVSDQTFGALQEFGWE